MKANHSFLTLLLMLMTTTAFSGEVKLKFDVSSHDDPVANYTVNVYRGNRLISTEEHQRSKVKLKLHDGAYYTIEVTHADYYTKRIVVDLLETEELKCSYSFVMELVETETVDQYLHARLEQFHAYPIALLEGDAFEQKILVNDAYATSTADALNNITSQEWTSMD